MKTPKISRVQAYGKKPLSTIKHKKEVLLQKCSEVKHKRISDISTKEIPILGATLGLFSPVPFGFLLGYGVGKLVEIAVNAIKRK